MTASAAVPSIVHGRDATLLDEDGASSFVFYWVIPFALMGNYRAGDTAVAQQDGRPHLLIGQLRPRLSQTRTPSITVDQRPCVNAIAGDNPSAICRSD